MPDDGRCERGLKGEKPRNAVLTVHMKQRKRIGKERGSEAPEEEPDGLSEDGLTYEQKLKKHRNRRRIAALILCVLLVAAVLGVYIYDRNRVYEEYSVKSSITLENASASTFVPLGDHIVKISSDGYSCVSSKTVVWNAAYEMQDIIVSTCESYVAVGEYGGSSIYIGNTEEALGSVETAYPLYQVSVSANGVVAALTEDDNAAYIEVISPEGTALVTGKSVLEKTGYPLALSLSPDGTKLIVSYLYISDGVVESKVVFYNFSEVGKNEVDRMVGGFNQYEEMIVPEVSFVSDDTAIAIADSLVSIYTMSQIPSLTAEFEIENEIAKVFYNEDYIGIVTAEDSLDFPYRLTIYSTKGKLIRQTDMETLYDDYRFSGSTLVMYRGSSVRVETVQGRIKFEKDVGTELLSVFPAEKAYEYLFIQADEIQRVRLK